MGRWLKTGLAVGAGTVVAGTAYVVAITYAPAPKHFVSDELRRQRFELLAPDYERKSRQQEVYLGIRRMRKEMIERHAGGRVLECAAGTGHNVEEYARVAGAYTPKAQRSPTGDDVDVAIPPTVDVTEPIQLPYSGDPKPLTVAEKWLQPAATAEAMSTPEAVAAARAVGHRVRPLPEGTPTSGAGAARAQQRLLSGAVVDTVPPITSVVLCDRSHAMTTALAAKVAARLGYSATAVDDNKEAARAWAQSPPVSAVEGEAKLPFAVGEFSTQELPFADDTFDTVVDVFSLCSYDDPVRACEEMARVCKPSGRVLLLEHGKGTSGRVNWYLDKWAVQHADHWGCWWNRDIRRVLRMSGLEVESREERHFGTTSLVVARPVKRAL